MFPLIRAGLVRVLAADPKLMELAFGRVIFETYGAYAADPATIADMLDQAVADMQARAARFAGVQREHTPAREHPFTVVLVDEVAFLTAYQPERKLRERIMAALATLTTQGRPSGTAWWPHCRTRARTCCRSGTCSPTGSPCGWMNPSRSTWCSATAPATAAPPAS